MSSEVFISQIVQVLIYDGYLVENRTRFFNFLNIPAAELKAWEGQYVIGATSGYQHFYKVIEEWVKQRTPSLGDLGQILKSCQLMSALESIQSIAADDAVIKMDQGRPSSALPKIKTDSDANLNQNATSNVVFVPEIVQVLINDAYFLDARARFLDVLGTPPADGMIWENLYKIGISSAFDYFTNLIDEWALRTSPSLGQLREMLRSCTFRSAADSLLSLGDDEAIIKTDQQKLINKWKTDEVIGFLGAGSFGFVFKVQKNDTLSAVKVTVTEGDASGELSLEQVAETDRELQVMKSLSKHNNVVQLLSSNVLPPSPNDSIMEAYGEAVALQYIDNSKHMAKYLTFVQHSKSRHTIVLEIELCGPTLHEWLISDAALQNMKNMSVEFAQVQQSIAQGIIDGLKHLHSANIIHRDLKPENIYFSPQRGDDKFLTPVKIGDFGVSRVMSGTSLETETTAAGTSIYRAPEVNKGKYGTQADLYSLGLVLWEVFEILAYTKTVEHQNRFESLTIDREKSVVAYNMFVPNLADVLLELTHRNPRDRFASIDSFKLEYCYDIRY